MAVPPSRPVGYEKIALLMSKDEDLGIFRQFRVLNAQNLLYLQAELHALELEFRKREKDDLHSADQSRQFYARDWGTLSRVYERSNVDDKNSGDENAQMRLILKIREKIKGYNEALLLYAEICKLQKPNSNGYTNLRDTLYRHPAECLIGQEMDIWRDPNLRDDFINLHSLPTLDPLTKWLVDTFLALYHGLLGQQYKSSSDPNMPVSGIYHYDSSHLQYPVFVFSIVLSSLLPVAAIVALYLVDSMGRRLGILAGFTAAFSMLLAFVTPKAMTRKIEIFAATAAFVAVQVVFINTSNKSTGQNSSPQ